MAALGRATANAPDLGYLFEGRVEGRERAARHLPIERYLGGEIPPALAREIQVIANGSASAEEFRTRLTAKMADVRDSIDQVERREITSTITSFAGDVRTPPEYVATLMQAIGSEPILHLRETKAPIGREEADALLNLKVTRGGPERFAGVQRTIRSLLGVDVDAFQADSPRAGVRHSEMDVDQFLAEANGAGIREALRLILDLELKKPRLALVEEPEVHLHPGLEHAVYSYLRDKSAEVQMFVTTHSTNFVDSVSFQNIYLLSRDQDKRTTCTALDEGDGALKIPAELGLRLSTVFMYDRLVFVEGPSDEAVLRELARSIGVDIPKSNVGFVQMGGVTNFAHYAAEGTIDILARRGIKMWFVTDRDERSDDEVKSMLDRLGPRAHLTVLTRRELENYLLDPAAVRKLIMAKREDARSAGDEPTEVDVARALREAADSLRPVVEDLWADRVLLRPVYLQRRGAKGTSEERIRAAIVNLQQRLETLADERTTATTHVEREWSQRALELAPGSAILDACCKQFGVRFNKDSGDSARLARLVQLTAVPGEVRRLLHAIVC